MSDLERAKRRLDRVLDRQKDKVGPGTLEMLLQKRAQDMRELSKEREDQPVISVDEIDGYNEQ